MNIQPILPDQGLNRIFFTLLGRCASRLGAIFNFFKCLTPSHLLTKVIQKAFVTC